MVIVCTQIYRAFATCTHGGLCGSESCRCLQEGEEAADENEKGAEVDKAAPAEYGTVVVDAVRPVLWVRKVEVVVGLLGVGSDIGIPFIWVCGEGKLWGWSV